jgi:hypothetical protein
VIGSAAAIRPNGRLFFAGLTKILLFGAIAHHAGMKNISFFAVS